MLKNIENVRRNEIEGIENKFWKIEIDEYKW